MSDTFTRYAAARNNSSTNSSTNTPHTPSRKRGEFIADIETWGSGGQMLDVLTLDDGSILLIRRDAVVLYRNRAEFDAGIGGRALPRS
jgi:hypothetical protein